MRPPSIIMFERLFLASLALSAIQFFIGYDAMIGEMEREPAFQQLGIGGGALTGTFVVGMAIYLLLWFLIARKASSVAKWILVVLSALGVVTFLASFASGQVTFDVVAMLGAGYYALEVAALVFLFRADANAWFRNEWTAEPATFD